MFNKLFNKKEKSKAREERSDKLHAMLGEMLAESGAELLGKDTIEAGRKAMERALKSEGLEYTADHLKAMFAGMQMMISCGGDNQLQVPMLMTISHLAKVEKGIEGIKTS